MANDKDKKEYKTGQIQDNGLMYDPVYDFNKDGKVDWIEEMERQKEIERSQKRWEEHQKERLEQKQYSPAPQASGASAGGCLGSFLVALFCLGGIGMCFTTESTGLKILFIFGGLALALASAYFCGLFGTKQKDDKELGAVESAAVKTKQRIEYNSQTDKAKLIKRITIVSVILIASVLLCNIGNMKKAHYYNKAISLVNAGEYKNAQEALSDIEEYKYKEKSELYDFCTALERFDKGERVYGPNFSYNAYSFDFKFSDAVEQKREKINRRIKQQKEEAERKKAEQSQSDADTDSGVVIPYVGMSESRLYATSLGTPKVKKNFNRECINGQQYWANKYEYYRNERVIFTARCVRGKVTQVWDDRNKAESTTAYSGGSKKSSSKSETIDPYDVKNYSNEEDFYYDHYDDFMDYYEAEDYYNEHQE